MLVPIQFPGVEAMTTAIRTIPANLQIMPRSPGVGVAILGVDLDCLSQEQIDQVMAISTEAGHTPTLRLDKRKDGLIPFLEIARGNAEPDPMIDPPFSDLWEKLIEALGVDFCPNGFSPVHLARGIKRVDQAA
jgi:hypothetical protein